MIPTDGYSNTFRARFWSKVSKTKGCWNWTAADDGYGYGAVGVGKLVRKAHRVNRNSGSGVRGVSWSKKSRKWLVVIGHNRMSHYGGLFDTIEQAEAAAIALRSELFTNNLLDREAM